MVQRSFGGSRRLGSRYVSRPRVSSSFALSGVLVGTLILGAIIWGIIANAAHTETQTCTVKDKDRTSSVDADGNRSSDARVYTDCGVMSVGDDLLTGHFSSADTYSDIEVGKTYEFKTRGYRVPLFSRFPNVIEVTEVN